MKFPLILALIFNAATTIFSQNPTAPPPTDSTKKIKVEYSDFGEYYLKNGIYVQKLSGNVRLREGTTLVQADTAWLENDVAILSGEVVIEQGDTLKIFSDSAWYSAVVRKSDLFGNVVLENGKQQLFTETLHYDLEKKVATYSTGATMTNGKSQLASRAGTYFVEEKQMLFRGAVLVTDPEFTLRTDSLNFNTETEVATFIAPTKITQKESKIYCEGGFYDIENNFAEFDKNPQYERGEQRGRATKMRYDGSTKEYTLEGNAYIEENTKKIDADIIRYNTDTEIAVLSGNAHYRDSTQDIVGDRIKYDSREKKYQITGRSKVVDGDNVVVADSLDFNDQLGAGLAIGNVVFIDTTNDYTIVADRLDYNKQSDFVNASSVKGRRPLMKTLIEKDTLFMSAQVLTSFKPDSTKEDRLLLAYQDVRIFKSDLQAVADSLSYSSADSIFRFFPLTKQPILWSDTSQFSGDTIRMALKNKKLDKIWLRQNSLVVNSEDETLFNQIKGDNCTAYFKEDKVDQMLVEGKAKAVYYAQDDKKAYIGVNQTDCELMRLFFGDNKVKSIKFYQNPQGKFVPIKELKGSPIQLDGFFWEKKRRPRSVADLLK